MNSENVPPLTDHEIQVLQLVAQGLTNKQIACSLNIKERTESSHIGGVQIFPEIWQYCH